MNKIEEMKKRIDGIRKLLDELARDLDALVTEQNYAKKSPAQSLEPIPEDEELRKEFDRLYEAFKEKNIPLIKESLETHGKAYLNAFCRANSLPLQSSKVSKKIIAEEILKWMAQREAITKRSFSNEVAKKDT